MAKKSNFPIILTERQQYWLEHLRSCKAAGTSYSDYARSHGLNINTFYTMILDVQVFPPLTEHYDVMLPLQLPCV